MKKRKLRKPLKYINGTKGMIALFMAVLMTPFLTLAMVLVETGRYNSAVSILDEALGVSSVSTLADFDPYLQDRWGLLSISQAKDLSTTYTNNIDVTKSVLGDSIEINSLDVEGMFPLSDSEILHNQIMEYSKLNAPTKLATNFLNLKELIGKLESLGGFKNIASAITTGVNTVDSVLTVAESADSLKKTANKLDTLKVTYESAYENFERSVNSLSEALDEERPEDPDEAKKYDDRIEDLRGRVEDSQKAYSEAIGSVTEQYEQYKTEMEECSGAITDVKNNLVEAAATAVSVKEDLSEKKKDLDAINESIEQMRAEGYSDTDPSLAAGLDYRASLEEKVAELKLQEGGVSALETGFKSVSDDWEDAFNSYSDAEMEAKITNFENLKNTVDNFSVDSVTPSQKISEETYHSVIANGYIPSEQINVFLLAQEQALKGGSLSSILKGLRNFFNSLFSISLAYEPALSAYIDTNYYNQTFGGLPGGEEDGGVIAIISAIGGILSAIEDFRSGLSRLNLIKILKALKKLIQNIARFFTSIGNFAIEIATNVYNLFESYEQLYCTTYTSFNLPCRTDYNGQGISFRTMTGYNLAASKLPVQNLTGVQIFDNFGALVNAIKDVSAGYGDDYTFSGAELEYILYGSMSEMSNQLYVFCALYLVRLILDLPAVLSNPEAQALAVASTFGYPVVMTLMVLVQPLAEMLLMVNGADIPIYATKIYPTPSGIVDFSQKLLSIVSFTTEQADTIKSNYLSAMGSTTDDFNYQQKLASFEETTVVSNVSSFLEFNYREYCFFLMLLTVKKERQMERLSNLIQMETLNYYKQSGAGFTFDMRQGFTYLGVQTNISVKQMLPSLANSSLFTIERTHYRGY